MAFLTPVATRSFVTRVRGAATHFESLFLYRKRTLATFAGPALLVSVAYVDPGNFATGIESGARYGYELLWVVLLSNLVAMLFQSLAAKLGIVRGESLATVCRTRLSPALACPMWLVSEVGAMATDLAELLGASIAFAILFGMPLLAGTILAGATTWVILLLERRRFRVLEVIIMTFIATIGLAYLLETLVVQPDWSQVAYHSVVPSLAGREALILAAGMVGATVMPHAIYLHSSLAAGRLAFPRIDDQRPLIRASNRANIFALGLAGLVNMAMVCVAAAVFHAASGEAVGVESAYETLRPLFGGLAAVAFLAALLASGLASSVIGTMAGQGIMQDFVRWRIPLWARRLATMLPTMVIVALGVDATHALVVSQVILSLVLPVPMLALIVFTSRRSVMGAAANSPVLTAAACSATLLVLTVNGLVVLDSIGVAMPF